MARILFSLILSLFLAAPLLAQEAENIDRSITGGAQTLEDILARQKGTVVDDEFRRDATGDPDSAAGIAAQLGTLGGASDPELWRAMRYGSVDIAVSSGGDAARVLMQDSGMKWLAFREGPLASKGAYLLIGTLVALMLFYMMRGRISIDGEKSGRTVTRFKSIERFAHWLMAGSFILLGLTGLISLFGRKVLIPAFGHEAFSTLAIASKWIHNNISWAFMIGLAMVFFMWVLHNLPSRTDLKWIAQGGGILSDGKHPPAKKFNAGQKVIFWSVILLGSSISLSGLSLLFPFELPMFAKTFAILNQTGLPQLLGYGELSTVLSPHEEMQFAQMWHAVVAFVLMAIILAHIYIGSIGMEGAYDAMSTGEVDEAWAHQHHRLWLDDIRKAEGSDAEGHGTPAE